MIRGPDKAIALALCMIGLIIAIFVGASMHNSSGSHTLIIAQVSSFDRSGGYATIVTTRKTYSLRLSERPDKQVEFTAGKEYAIMVDRSGRFVTLREV